MGEEYRFTRVGILTILMILLAAAFTSFVFDSSLKSNEGQDATILKVTCLVVVGVFVLALASFYSFTIQIADGKLKFWSGLGSAGSPFPSREFGLLRLSIIPSIILME